MYWRAQGGERRAWADFRDLGGKREPLKIPGEKRATTDPKLAEVLCAQRLAHVTRDLVKSQERAVHSLPPRAYLAKLVEEYLVARAKAGVVTDERIAASQGYLTRAMSSSASVRTSLRSQRATSASGSKVSGRARMGEVTRSLAGRSGII